MLQPLAQWRSWHLTMEGAGGPTWGKGWLPLTSCPEGECDLAKPVCMLAGASLLDAAPGSGTMHPADVWAGREMQGWQPLFPLMQGQEKLLCSDSSLPVPPTCIF